jgi:uncharacterized YigZ family protein
MVNSCRVTILEPTVFEIEKVKGSRFIGYAYPLSLLSNMEQRVQELWQSHPEARHICWAYRGAQRDLIRTVDDGEPSGTAGRPILTVIEGRGFEGVGVAVVRYFGGTKLGTGGLARAYSAAAQAVLNESTEKQLLLRRVLTFNIHYSYEGSLMYLLEQNQAIIQAKQYTDQVKITAIILTEKVDTIVHTVTESTAGKAHIIHSSDEWS